MWGVVLRFGAAIQSLNYQYELVPRTHSVDKVLWRSYDLRSTPDKLRTELLSSLSNDEVVVDVGAHRGTFTLPMAGSGAKVYSFEPNPVVAGYLKSNVHVNDFNNVQVFDIGLSAEQGESEFFISDPPQRSSFEHDNAIAQGAKIVSTETVPIRTLDSLVESGEVEPPNHLKIDVEGHGEAVIHGAWNTIKRHSPTIYTEPHGNSDELKELLTELGYNIRELGYPWVCEPK